MCWIKGDLILCWVTSQDFTVRFWKKEVHFHKPHTKTKFLAKSESGKFYVKLFYLGPRYLHTGCSIII